ncbi:MAG: hypothetical protein V4530_05910 [Pseudomonadota bacterium]
MTYTDLITGKPLEPWAEQAMNAASSNRLRALAKALDCDVADVEEVLAEIIADSIDMDWNSSVGAAAIVSKVAVPASSAPVQQR